MKRPRLTLRLGALALVVAASCGAGACAPTVSGLDSPSETGLAEQSAMAATYRFMFADNASGLRSNAAAYCLAVGPRSDPADPPPGVLGALSDVTPPVRPVSACTIDREVRDSAGRPSLLFNLRPLGCDTPESCLFEGGYYESNASSSFGRYRARKIGGQWQVAREGPQAIS